MFKFFWSLLRYYIVLSIHIIQFKFNVIEITMLLAQSRSPHESSHLELMSSFSGSYSAEIMVSLSASHS
jgi:hypothetical protein